MKRIVCLFISLLAGAANAVPITYSDQSTFESQGVIAFNNDFESWNTSSGFAYPADPYTEQGVTYNNTDNLIVGVNSPYTNQGNHITNNYWTPVTGILNDVGDFDMFAFDVGVSGNANLTLTLNSNVDAYTFNITAPDANTQALDFWGFTLDGGEYFTSFSLASIGSGNLPMMDNVKLGNISASVPEPASLALLAIGLIGISLSKKKKNP